MDTRQYGRSERKRAKRVQRHPEYQALSKRFHDLSAALGNTIADLKDARNTIDVLTMERDTLSKDRSKLSKENDHLGKQLTDLQKISENRLLLWQEASSEIETLRKQMDSVGKINDRLAGNSK